MTHASVFLCAFFCCCSFQRPNRLFPQHTPPHSSSPFNPSFPPPPFTTLHLFSLHTKLSLHSYNPLLLQICAAKRVSPSLFTHPVHSLASSSRWHRLFPPQPSHHHFATSSPNVTAAHGFTLLRAWLAVWTCFCRRRQTIE